MMSVHISNFGSFSGHLKGDQDGYVHTSIKAVMKGTWDGDLTHDRAAEIAAENRKAIANAGLDIAAWR